MNITVKSRRNFAYEFTNNTPNNAKAQWLLSICARISICDKCLKPTIRDVFPVVFREFHTEGENKVMFDSYFCVCVCLMHWNHFYRSRRKC